MKLPLRAVFPVILFAFLLLAFSLSPYWHALAKKQESTSYTLYSYDRVAQGEKACFSLEVNTASLSGQKNEPLVVSVQGKTLLAEKIKIAGNFFREFCFSTEKLPKKALVEISIGNESLYYHIRKGTVTNTKPGLFFEEPALVVLKNGYAKANFSVKNFPQG